MNELIETISKPKIPEEWDFVNADKEFDVKILQWRRLTGETLSIAFVFYVKLAIGHRRKSSLKREQLPTWTEWVESKGIGKNTLTDRFKALGWIDGALVQKHTGDMENYTPPYIIGPVREALGGIDLDPASCELAQTTIQATEYFTEEDNGLSKPWHGRVFLNPPYKMPLIQDFTDKLIEELPNIEAAILLTNNNTDTKWFHKCAKEAKAICLTLGRINFYTPEIEKTMPTNGQAFFYYGDNVERFGEYFKEIGLIIKWNTLIR